MAEHHLSRFARDRYLLESLRFAAIQDARRVAAQMDVSAADLYALGLIDEALRTLLQRQAAPAQMTNAASFLDQSLGADPVRATQLTFVSEFPTTSVYRGEVSPVEYLHREEGKGAKEEEKEKHSRALSLRGEIVSLEELLLVNLHNGNPAATTLTPLFDDAPLEETAYEKMIEGLGKYFRDLGIGDQAGESLIDMLRAPARASPHSLAGQLEYIIARWGDVLGADFVTRLLRGLDFVKEEVKRFGVGGPGGETPVPTYFGEPEYERYSPDKEWMPRLVLIAKNTYVWLEQLSRKHQRWIQTLDQIPDEELDILRDRGFTGLWLIGLWERSRASQKIKQRMGQEDAVASAYSLYSYDIANDLGGWEALNNLRSRAWQRGIRLSADMVPNHMGIDSQWVIEHPDWFLSLPYPPYPSYNFNSEDLSDDSRVGIFLEDHYYNHSDASVVFKRVDYQTSDYQTRYIYHGNDGTSFPWNDTAQLDYSKAEVREAVIQTILHVARNFPVIRFDAAMTLAKKHIQRLWFPEPGAGGAIPSRAEHGMTRSEFDAAIPQEFWREVVDRVAAEVPDTLLLAEAFWLLEGYFVRTLGMHRVYNSAFMHMLRDEDNAKYRTAIKNTLEFDPQILKRYVNFMNNPDEKTAVEQFGDGDKYFGVATVLATLPGLPMFGHGQIEGFREKYGMEFRKPKWDELSNEGLIRGHEWKIFPLLHRRYLFADVENFFLYDLFTANGAVDENVFAYSNVHGDQRGLVLYHNRFADTRGWIKTSAAYLDKGSGELRQKSLAEALGLPFEGYVIFKDYVTHLEYIRSCEELWQKGLYVELHAYQHHVFMDWQFVDDERWGKIHFALNGAGVESMSAKWEEMFGVKAEAVEEDVRVKMPRKKAAGKKEERRKKAAVKKPAKNKKPATKSSLAKHSEGAKGKKTAMRKPAGKSNASKGSKAQKTSSTKTKSVKSAKRFQALLGHSRKSIVEGKGLSRDEFWRNVGGGVYEQKQPPSLRVAEKQKRYRRKAQKH
ncbi:MAG: alpha-amylase family glycosyl hydrolase [Chloroflexota bacterium]